MNGGDFDVNMNYNMCMKGMLLFIDIKLRTVDRYIYIIMHINDADSNTHDIDVCIHKQHAALCL